MNDLTYQILRHAVNIARNDQVQKKKDLVDKLLLVYPDNRQEIDEALNYWGRSIINPN